MKHRLSSFLALLLTPVLAFAAGEPVLLKKISGTVEIKAAPDASWTQAKPGAQLPSGGSVRTGADGRAELKFKNKSSVWLKPSTNLAVEQKGPKNNRLVLGAGALKVRVPHLGFREKFEVKTPMAVASVRGTVFTVDDNNLQTLFGHVKMHLDNGKKYDVPQGMNFDGSGVSMLSQLQETLGMEDWSPGISEDDRRSGLQAFLENRQQIRDYASDALARNQELVDSLAANVKQDDFAAGRTLTDVHGNLVRVEQRLDRPNDHTVQIVNIVLRTSYASGGLRKFSYNGPPSSRVDALIARAEFNQALPTSINEFPGFFSSHDDVKVDHAAMILANMENPNEITTIAFLGDRNLSSASDDIDSDLYVGNVNGRANLFGLTAANAGGAGLSRYTEDTGTDSINFKGVNGELYGAAAKRFTLVTPGTGGPTDGAIWICTENFAINNSGQVRNVADYTGGGANIQELLGNSAAQSVVFVKKDVVGPAPAFNNSSTGDLLTGKRNIDLVVIPDLFLSIVKSLATSADAFKTTY